MTLPYTDIIDRGDRHWSMRLLDRLKVPSISEDELSDLIRALRVVSDPRLWEPLHDILTNRNLPQRIRRAAGSVVRELDWKPDTPRSLILQWWKDGDSLLREHALLCMKLCCQDIVVEVASNPAHELHGTAIFRMQFYFDRPEQQQLKIAALNHIDPIVRENAAYVLLWDEPIKAEEPLVRTLKDDASKVAVEASNTLQYYPTMNVARCLHEQMENSASELSEAATESFESIRSDFCISLTSSDRHVREHIRDWLCPIWELLAFTDDELALDTDTYSSKDRKNGKQAVSLSELLTILDDTDMPTQQLQEHLRNVKWKTYSDADRNELAPILLMHQDQIVRYIAVDCFGEWKDTANLEALVNDADFTIRKSAMYSLSLLPPDSMIGQMAWDYLNEQTTLGVNATETLATFVTHTARNDAILRLFEIANDCDQREILRVAALEHLKSLGASKQVASLVRIVDEPPAVTWELHITLLDCIAVLGLQKPRMDQLKKLDNLHIQEAIARIESA